MAERIERADAARNRSAILRAAERLFAEREAEGVSIEEIARAAGVGKGTVFHRFGSRSGLIRELLAERSHALEESTRSGPPPLGPGAIPAARLNAFLDAVIAMATRNIALMAAYERSEDGRQEAAMYQTWHRHVSALITSARPDLDAELLAHILLGSLHSDLVLHLLRRGETSRLRSTLHQLVETLLGPGGAAPPSPEVSDR
ncbi:MAG TPA: helix-turn-helix domain-containing protein [Candidatus Dormibacteraeota bacterium]|nr:helix-turn-helix domain-containing protein [Candidatus Dormibacteraeota bacterium]